jgi:hypothetical protein
MSMDGSFAHLLYNNWHCQWHPIPVTIQFRLPLVGHYANQM